MDYQYEPQTSKLEGTLKEQSIYADGDKLKVYMLHLKHPINIIQPKTIFEGEYNTSEYNITEIQLTGIDSRIIKDITTSQNIKVSGKLFHAHTAHHYAKILMDVDTITLIS